MSLYWAVILMFALLGFVLSTSRDCNVERWRFWAIVVLMVAATEMDKELGRQKGKVAGRQAARIEILDRLDEVNGSTTEKQLAKEIRNEHIKFINDNK